MQSLISKKKERFLSWQDKAILLLLCFAAMNFQAKFFYFVYFSFVIYCFFIKKIYISGEMFIYLIFSLVYSIYAIKDGPMAVLRIFAFVMFFFVGYGVSLNKSKEHIDPWLRASLISLALGSFIHLLLNFIINFGHNIGRNILDIWSDEIMSATGQATLSCLAIGLAAAWFVYPRRKIERIMSLIMIVIILLFNLILAGRTIFLMISLSFFGCLFLLWRKLKEKNYKQNIVFIILVVVSLSFLAYSFNFFGIRSTIENSNFIHRFSSASTFSDWTDDTRMSRKMSYITNLFNYPFGGNHMKNMFGYAHDLLLDAYDYGGVLLFIPLFVIVISAFKSFWRFIKQNNVSLSTKLIVLGMIITIGIEFCFEPIFAGMPWVFACFAFIHGTICAINYRRIN